MLWPNTPLGDKRLVHCDAHVNPILRGHACYVNLNGAFLKLGPALCNFLLYVIFDLPGGCV